MGEAVGRVWLLVGVAAALSASAAFGAGAAAAKAQKPAAPPAADVAPTQEKAPAAAPVAKQSDMTRLFTLVKTMRQRLSIASETSFFMGQRHLKVFHYHSELYVLAEKWLNVYAAAVRKLLTLSVSEYLCAPERLLELKEAVEWGKLHAIAEPWYYKKGYRKLRAVLNPPDVPDCLWQQFDSR
ncbi:MAG: hypothetical protein HY303_12230 [Candidatus Wallbacteria bacterium]|nr:hypothetical protein [Candidatus Wallbacteria bacterium]